MIEIDQPLTDNGMNVPVGTVVRDSRVNSGNNLILRTYAGWTYLNSGQFMYPKHDRPQDLTVLRVGSERRLTPTQYKQKVRTTTLGAAVAHSVRIDPVQRALRKLGAEEVEASIGMYVHYSDHGLLDQLPDGTVLLHGADASMETATYDYHSWAVTHNHRVQFAVGGMAITGLDLLVVHSIPGHDSPKDWVTEEFVESMQAEIDDFKDAAFAIGAQARSDQDWCGHYQVAMDRVGITQAWGNRPKPMTSAELGELPEGSIVAFFVPGNGEQHEVFERGSNGSLARLFGTVERTDDERADTPAFVMRSGPSDRIRFSDATLGQNLPIGTVMSGPYSRVTRRGDGQWSHNIRRDDATVTVASHREEDWAVLSFGNGVFNVGRTGGRDMLADLPVGTTVLHGNGARQWEMSRLDEDGVLVHVAASAATDNLGDFFTVVGDPGDEPTITDYRMLSALPRHSQIRHSGRQVYVKRGADQWRSGGGYGTNRDSAYSTSAESGTLTLVMVGGTDGGTEPGAVVDSIEMAVALPYGTLLNGERSGNTYIVMPDGVRRIGRSGHFSEWDNFDLSDGVLTIQQPVEPVRSDWPNRDHMLGNEGVATDVLDSMPPGTAVYGIGSRHIYVRVGNSGWLDTTANTQYARSALFNGTHTRITVVGRTDGSGLTSVSQ